VMEAIGESREFDGARLEVKEVSWSKDKFTLEIEVSCKANSPYAVELAEGAKWDLFLYDREGSLIRQAERRGASVNLWVPDGAGREVEHEKSYVVSSFQQGHREGERVAARWVFRGAKPNVPETLLWKSPEATRWFKVPFELKDVPVPE
jgi:hypothetical protein